MSETLLLLWIFPIHTLKVIYIFRVWLQIDLNFAADVSTLNNALQSLLSKTPNTLCIHPCSSPWKIWPPFYLPCAQGRAWGCPLDCRRAEAERSTAPGCLIPAFLPARPSSSCARAHLKWSLPQSCERCLHLFVSLEIEGLIHLSRIPALCRRAAAGGKRSSRPECLPVSHIQSSGSARNNPISDIKVGECPPEAIPINLGSIHFSLIQKGMGRSCLWISNYTPHTSPLISALCTLKYYFKASLKQNAAGQKC